MPDVLNAAKVSNFFVIMATMRFPTRINGLRMATILLAFYSVIWIGIEGRISQATGFGTGITIVGVGHVIQRLLGGRTQRQWYGMAITAIAGSLTGVGSSLMTLVSMAVKTGIHGHGPEFTQDEIEWVIGQIPLWGVAGTIAGLGLGFLLLGYTQNSQAEP